MAPPAPWTVVDVVTVALAVATLMLGALAIFIGVLAAWGYRDIKEAALKKAEEGAREVATDVAARSMQAFLDKQATSPDISEAYRDTPT